MEILAQSENAFVLVLDEVGAGDLKKIQKLAERFFEFKKISVEESPFALSNAVAKKNIKEAWAVFQKRTQSGEPAERIFSSVFMGIKNP